MQGAAPDVIHGIYLGNVFGLDLFVRAMGPLVGGSAPTGNGRTHWQTNVALSNAAQVNPQLVHCIGARNWNI